MALDDFEFDKSEASYPDNVESQPSSPEGAYQPSETSEYTPPPTEQKTNMVIMILTIASALLGVGGIVGSLCLSPCCASPAMILSLITGVGAFIMGLLSQNPADKKWGIGGLIAAIIAVIGWIVMLILVMFLGCSLGAIMGGLAGAGGGGGGNF